MKTELGEQIGLLKPVSLAEGENLFCSLVRTFKVPGLENMRPLGWSYYQKSNIGYRSQQIIKTPFMELNTYNMDVPLVSCLKTLAVSHRIIELYVSLFGV